MKTPTSASYKRTVHSRRGGGGMLAAGTAITFAALPLGVMLWVLPVSGFSLV